MDCKLKGALGFLSGDDLMNTLSHVEAMTIGKQSSKAFVNSPLKEAAGLETLNSYPRLNLALLLCATKSFIGFTSASNVDFTTY